LNVEIKPTKHSAPGQYLGFALQPVRAFYHLLTAPKGAKVALELQDDVSVHYLDGSVCLEQTKSALKQNPIADWDEDLWKAFDNWRVMLHAGQCDATCTKFRLYVTPAKKGAFAEALSAAKSNEEIEAALAVIKTKLGKKKTPPASAAKVKALLDAAEGDRHGLVGNFELEADANDPLESIRDRLRPSVAEAHIDIIVRSGIGQAKQAMDRLIQQGEKPILDADAFRRTPSFARTICPACSRRLASRPTTAWSPASPRRARYSCGSLNSSKPPKRTDSAPSATTSAPQPTKRIGQNAARFSLAAWTVGTRISSRSTA
jgi:hypothetical protein